MFTCEHATAQEFALWTLDGQPIIKPVIAIAGDVLEIGPDAVVTGQRLPRGASAPSIALAGHYQTWAGPLCQDE